MHADETWTHLTHELLRSTKQNLSAGHQHKFYAVSRLPKHLTEGKDSIMQKRKLGNLEVSAIGLLHEHDLRLRPGGRLTGDDFLDPVDGRRRW
jgi:hypothetical protein